MFDLITREFKTPQFPDNRGDATMLFQKIALMQLKALVIEEVYRAFDYKNAEIRTKDKSAGSFEEAGAVLVARLNELREQMVSIESSSWKEQFVNRCNELLRQREEEWASSWQLKCSGKQFLFDLRKECKLRVGQETFKRRLLIESKVYQDGGSESWKLLKASFDGLIS